MPSRPLDGPNATRRLPLTCATPVLACPCLQLFVKAQFGDGDARGESSSRVAAGMAAFNLRLRAKARQVGGWGQQQSCTVLGWEQ